LSEVLQARIPGSSDLATYSGKQTSEAIKSWALGLIPDKVQHINSQPELDTFLHRCGAAVGRTTHTGLPSARWDVCLLLLSDKKHPSALYRSLSVQFSGQVRTILYVPYSLRGFMSQPC
jgi:hypothetical protein